MQVKIVYFSGTGNTRFLSEKILQKWKEKRTDDIEMIPVEDALDNDALFENEDTILGIGYPVYDLMPPKIILDFTAKLKKSESQKLAFVFSTYTSYPLDANSYLIEKLQEKGYFVIAQDNFKAPGASGYFYSNPNYPLVKERSIFRKGINQQMDHFINELIYSDKNNLKKMPVRYHYLNKLHQNFSRLTLGNLFYRNLKKNINCINCGQCARSCPDSNLIIHEGTLIIKKSNGCMRCLRCVQICNKKAINFTSSKRTGNYSRKDIENAYHKATS